MIPPADQAPLIAFLRTAAAYGATGSVEQIDTHAASVFLAGDRAWKLKRAVRFGYLDFSTPDLRRAALEAELRLNRRTAPGLYLGVRPVTRDSEGRFAIGGMGDAVDWLLEMRRFPQEARLDHYLGRKDFDSALWGRLAEALVRFHADAAEAPGMGGADAIRRIIRDNRASMADVGDLLPADEAQRLEDASLAAVEPLADLLDSRARSGRVRHCHGDLHLANIVVLDGVPTPFDCLEFSPRLAAIDVLYDLSFLLMDLWFRNAGAEANLVFNRYFDLSPQDEAGVALSPLFLSMRAAIRAHVTAAGAVRAGASASGEGAAPARRYLAAALDFLAPPPARLIAIGGLSGTGKSSLARALAPGLGGAPGARIIRSDVIRKQRAGVPPETRLDEAAYTRAETGAVYAEMLARAATALQAGQTVIVDAVFGRAEERRAAADTAAAQGAAFHGLWLDLPLEVREQRIAARRDDASDADVRVARAQMRMDVGDLSGWQRLEAGGTVAQLAGRAGKVLIR